MLTVHTTKWNVLVTPLRAAVLQVKPTTQITKLKARTKASHLLSPFPLPPIYVLYIGHCILGS